MSCGDGLFEELLANASGGREYRDLHLLLALLVSSERRPRYRPPIHDVPSLYGYRHTQVTCVRNSYDTSLMLYEFEDQTI